MLTCKTHLIILRISLSHGITGFLPCGCLAYMDGGREVKHRLYSYMKTLDKLQHYINSHKLKAYKYFTQTYYINICHSNTASFLPTHQMLVNYWLGEKLLTCYLVIIHNCVQRFNPHGVNITIQDNPFWVITSQIGLVSHYYREQTYRSHIYIT